MAGFKLWSEVRRVCWDLPGTAGNGVTFWTGLVKRFACRLLEGTLRFGLLLSRRIKKFPPIPAFKERQKRGAESLLGVRQQDYFFLLVFPLAVLVVGSTVLPVCFLAPCPILEVDLAITRSPNKRRLRNRYELRYSYRRVSYQSLQNLKYQCSQFLNFCEEYLRRAFLRRSLQTSQQRRTVAAGGREGIIPLLCSCFH